MSRNIDVISYAYSGAGKRSGSEQGPSTLEKSLTSMSLCWHTPITTSAKEIGFSAIDTIATLNHQSAELSAEIIQKGHFIISLGGDHSCAIGTWSGVAKVLKQPIGMLWIDAHADAHTPQTSHTQNVHGMPLATLLGFGDPRLTLIAKPSPKIDASQTMIIGLRDYEPEEQNLIEACGIHIPEATHWHDPSHMHHAIEHMLKNTAGFGISIDVDAFDPEDMPGTSLPVENGLRIESYLKILKPWINHPKCLGLEIAEFNPERDINHQTLNHLSELIKLRQHNKAI